MKKVLILAFLVASQYITAQVTQNLGDFTAVRVFDRISVTLVKASENKIVINGSRAGDVEVVTKNGDLKVRMKVSQLLAGEDVDATIYYTGLISTVEASEGSFVGSADTFKATSFELSAKEGAIIKLNLDVAKLKSKANSGGILQITGKASNHDISITSGGEFKGKELSTTQTTVSISIGGVADVNASEFVDAKTKAGGDIMVYGNPKQVNQKTFAGGNIVIKG
jgi:Putative auto-transporter adhesin, head GIN domain